VSPTAERIYQIKIHEPLPKGIDDVPLRFRAVDGSYYLTGEELERLHDQGFEPEIVRSLRESDLPVRFFLTHDGAVNNPPPDDAKLAVLARLLAEGRAGGEVHIRYLGRNRTPPPDGFLLDVAHGRRAYAWQVVPAEEAASRPGLFERFSALRELCSDPDARVVLALGSGGVRLFCHAPAIRLFETLGCAEHVDEIWGTSAGAIAGLLYAQGLSPHAIEQLGYDLYGGRMDLRVRPSKLQFLRALVRDAVLPSGAPSSAGFVDCANGMARMLEHYCAERQPRRPFYALAFNLAECRAEVLTPLPVPHHLRELMTQTDAREAALASATVPLLFVPRPIRRSDGDVHYIDGSTTEDVPLHSVMQKWDRDRAAGVEHRRRLVILAVKLTGNLERHRLLPGRMSKLRIMQTVVAASIEHMHRRTTDLVRSRPDVDVLTLDLTDSSPDFFETRCIPEYLRVAKEVFPEQLAELEQQLRAGRPR
jgi:predicted acylesterase/phospholipase RssA